MFGSRLCLLALLGLAHAAAAARVSSRHNKPATAPTAPQPVAVSVPRKCLSVPENLASQPTFTTLVAAAQATDFYTLLANPELTGSLFAPTDAAFANLLDALDVTAEELLGDTELLSKVLKYHFVPTLTNLTNAEDGQKLPTLLSFGGEAQKGEKAAGEASLLTVDKVVGKEWKSLAHGSSDRASKNSKLRSETYIVPSGVVSPAAKVLASEAACKATVHVIDAVLVPELEPMTA